MKVYISADIEGVAGVCAFEHLSPGNFEWESARRWMTAEVNAAAEGAFAAGATEIVVSDSHGNALNLLPDSLDPRLRLVRGFPRPLLQMQGVEEAGTSACLLIGYHVSIGGQRGVLAHTYFGGFHRLSINGVAQSEGSLNAALAGEFGVPVVFMSGDQDATIELQRSLPWIGTVVTKQSIGYTATRTLSPSQSCDAIRAGVQQALARREQAQLHRLAGPYLLEIEFKRRQAAEWMALLPPVELHDTHTVRMRADSLAEAMRWVTFCIFGLARPQ